MEFNGTKDILDSLRARNDTGNDFCGVLGDDELRGSDMHGDIRGDQEVNMVRRRWEMGQRDLREGRKRV